MKIDKEKEIEIKIPLYTEDVQLDGVLYIPPICQGLILFAHGSGSGRYSPRNRFVAQYLNNGAYATLLFDLLTRREESVDLLNASFRFNIDLLSKRLKGTAEWVRTVPELKEYPIGYFGASTGAAAALIASTQSDFIRAVVSRGGRPDLASPVLGNVKTPTLLIVGGNDYEVLELNRRALEDLVAPAKELQIVPGATHLFEEPGTLEEVARLSIDWFIRYVH